MQRNLLSEFFWEEQTDMEHISKKYQMTSKLNTLFISHGPPGVALMDVPAARFLKALGAEIISRPTAILCVSAHWESWRPMFSGAQTPVTIHDFGGPPPLFNLRYPAPGAPWLAEKAAALLNDSSISASVDMERGLDHGAWIPLSLMYPDADIPVVQLSIQTELDLEHHVALGQTLAPLREDGVLIMGSGGATHNLPEVSEFNRDDPQADYASAFDDWLAAAVTDGKTAALLDYKNQAPSPERNHPWPAEHFLPLFVPLGAAGHGISGRVLHRSFLYGVLSMAAFLWE